MPSRQPKNRFLLLYGSATGQAQAISEEIADKAVNFGLKADLYSLEETGKRFNLEEEECVVIVTSTSGDGDPPPNAEKFMRRIKKRTLTSDYLSHMHYALLGLGDTNYSNFCRCAQDMDKRLQELGATRFYATGLADDGVGLEVVADPWLEGLYPALQDFLGVSHDKDIPVSETIPPSAVIDSENKVKPASTLKGDIKEDLENVAQSGTSKLNGSIADGAGDKLISDITSLSVNGRTSGTEKPGVVNGSAEESNNVSNSGGLQLSNGDSFSSSDNKSKILTDQSESSSDSSDSNSDKNLSSKEYVDYFEKLQRGETPCKPASTSVTSVSIPLVISEPEMHSKALTVPVLPPHFLKVQYTDELVQVWDLIHQNGCKLPSAASDVYKVKVKSVKVMTHPEAVKKTLCLSLDLGDSGIQYCPGDSVSIVCPNNSSEVSLLLERLGAAHVADKCMEISVLADTKKRRAAVPPHCHEKSTLRHIFTTCINIRETPSKALIRALVEYTSNPIESRRMQELCSKEGAQLYTHVVREKHVTLLDFLYAFPSCSPPVERILEHLPRLQPRPYSACSCQDVSATSLDVVFNVVNVPLSAEDGRLYERRGVCTGWLDDLTQPLQTGQDLHVQEPPTVSIFMRTNQHFRPPEDLAQPLIMIGPGTGVAPFIGFLQKRALQKKDLSDPSQYGDTWLFYGCRNKDKDFLFREELEQFKSDGVVTQLCVACSRDAPTNSGDAQPGTDGAYCRYVQDLMLAHSSKLCHLLTELNVMVYVCGDAKNMAKDVAAAFEDILMKHKEMSRDDAKLFMMKKRMDRTFFEDVWV